jgi:hypothetical protein
LRSTATEEHTVSTDNWYEIRLRGRLDARWSAWFDGMTLTPGADGTTVLQGLIVDQAALHGVLARLRDIGLPLISVRLVEPGATESHTTHSTDGD